jgi:putative transposase
VTEHREFYRRRLPHWQPPGATLFVTFRLAHSLPGAVIADLYAERQRREAALSHISDLQERQRQAERDERRTFGRWDAALDAANSGPRWLSNSQVAGVVSDALHYRDEREYDLLAFCIMPNHMHLVCTPLTQEDGTYRALNRILQSLKRHTARQANRILKRHGSFWQAESYDRFARDENELERIIWYVIDNPVRAGLVSSWESWPWTYAKM